MSCLYCIRVSYPVLAFSALHVSMDTYHMPWIWDYKFLRSECPIQLHFPNGSLKVERIWMYRNDLPMKVIRIINYLPSLECKVALFVSLVFVLGWMVGSTSISKALLVYLFIYFWVWGRGWGMVSLANRRREWVQYFPHSNVIFCSHARELLTQYLSLSQGLCHSEINEEKACQIPWSCEILKKLGVWSNLNLERLHIFLRRN